MVAVGGRRRDRPRAVPAVLLVVAALALAVVPGVAGAAPSGESWAAELAVADGDDTGVVVAASEGGGVVRLATTTPRVTADGPAPAEGELLLAPHRLGAVTDRVAADLTAGAGGEPDGSAVVVDVRGRRDDGSWGQWTTAAPDAPALLGTTTLEVQVRLTLTAGPGGAGPTVSRLRLTADRAPSPRATTPAAPADPTPFTAAVVASRIGLVGERTANGHRITAHDRFVALPSRRALSPAGAGDYTVRVCTAAGRCTWAPVWDVGPWNSHDDYWNPADAASGPTRERYRDLSRGVPEAQAAHDDGYAGGRDGYGRAVSNPAGIDLADGTFADLGLSDDARVTVAYQWTGSGPAGTAADDVVTVRSAPRDDAPAVGTLAPHARVPVACAALSPDDVLALRAAPTSDVPRGWLRVGTGQYVPATALEAPRVPSC